jgi:hypothetical protein
MNEQDRQAIYTMYAGISVGLIIIVSMMIGQNKNIPFVQKWRDKMDADDIVLSRWAGLDGKNE